MRRPRLLLVALVPVLAVAAASAQSPAQSPVQSPAQSPAQSPGQPAAVTLPATPHFDVTAPAHDSRTELPAMRAAQTAKSDLAKSDLAKALLARKTRVLIAQNKPVCYTMRSYQYGAASDGAAAQPTGQTTCLSGRNSASLVVVLPK